MSKKKIVSEGNKLKSIAGNDLQKIISETLISLATEGYIKNFETNVNYGHRDFSYKKQFLANFSIKTHDHKFILVRSSTSFRLDRVKTGFYDFEGILNHSAFSSDIIATIYLVPDSEINNKSFTTTRDSIHNKEFYSPATHLLTFSEFISFIEEYKYNVSEKKLGELSSEDLLQLSVKELGSYYGKSGNQFERQVVTTMSNHDYLIGLKEGTLKNNLFEKIVNTILEESGLLLRNLIEIKATNSVPLLKNGGNAKTDVILDLNFAKSENIIKTISIKKTTKSRVSCHDYKANDFIRVLNCKNTRLAEYFLFFQMHPTDAAFKKSLPDSYSTEEFQSLLKLKSNVFNEWVITGAHDKDNLTVPELQVSQFLLFNTPKTLSFYPSKNYISKILKESKLKYGVPFSWTYPSKQRGKRIQLKLPIM